MRIIAGKYGWYCGREEPLKVLGPFRTWQDASQARIEFYAQHARRIEWLKRMRAREVAKSHRRQEVIARDRLRITLGELVRAA
jgi:hypothetical protein